MIPGLVPFSSLCSAERVLRVGVWPQELESEFKTYPTLAGHLGELLNLPVKRDYW